MDAWMFFDRISLVRIAHCFFLCFVALGISGNDCQRLERLERLSKLPSKALNRFVADAIGPAEAEPKMCLASIQHTRALENMAMSACIFCLEVPSSKQGTCS